ncbi:hypothetical protein Pint_03988 [Pistacia integerrima]|uniref:Uncharacterized protein n=1 Tax=Pistacia integerrima TaxID=434235 RepID=A0ACC0Z8S7_9ROSI|nr:hypothetical protein Pint_03988 [Pistacia integerrima]
MSVNLKKLRHYLRKLRSVVRRKGICMRGTLKFPCKKKEIGGDGRKGTQRDMGAPEKISTVSESISVGALISGCTGYEVDDNEEKKKLKGRF